MGVERFPFAEVDLDAISGNVRAIRRRTGVPVLAVVKCDGYGHGLLPSAEASLRGGAGGVAVRGLEEVRGVRRALPKARIVNLYPHHPATYREAMPALRLGAEQTVQDELDVREYARAARSLRTTAVLHLKVDTGLGRHGAEVGRARSIIEEAARTPRVRLAGVFTTLAERGPESSAGR